MCGKQAIEALFVGLDTHNVGASAAMTSMEGRQWITKSEAPSCSLCR